MTPKEKAGELYTKFQVYDWYEIDGYITDDITTKRIICEFIDEILDSNMIHLHLHQMDFWKEVKQEIEKI